MAGVGIIGFGYWGPNYLRVLRQCDEVTYIAICDSDATRLKAIKNEQFKCYTQYDELLADPFVDAVIIATPSPTHYVLAKKAVEAGKHILVEKPVTLNPQEAQELTKLAEKNAKVFVTGHIFLYNDGVEYLREHIKKQEFGQVHEIECIRQGHGPIRTEINVMWDLATHDISILLHLLEKMPAAVAASGFKYRKETLQEDSVIVTLRFPNEVRAVIKVNWQYPIKERRITVIGSNQMMRFSDTQAAAPIVLYYKAVRPHGEVSNSEYGAFKMITSDNGYLVPVVKIREPLLLQLQDFLTCIKTGKKAKSDGALGTKVVSILAAAQKSLQQDGAFVEVEYAAYY